MKKPTEMNQRQVEVYYGRFSGSAQVWDTAYVCIPVDTPDNQIEEAARAQFLNEHSLMSVAFCGLYNSNVGEED